MKLRSALPCREWRNIIRRRLLPFVMTSALFIPGIATSQVVSDGAMQSTGAPAVRLRIDPRLIAEAAEVWALIAGQENCIWPGWDATDTPILFYLPGEQDVLINHPRPPKGFVSYDGPVRFPGGRIMARDGPTILGWDGQNTWHEIEGIPTLVVADALSNLRQEIRGLLEDPRSPAEKAKGLGYSRLAIDPYNQLSLVVHEAFHVFQRRAAPGKGANEMLLSHYPVLSVENNVGFAQEGMALAAALRSDTEAALRAAIVRWLALRQQRRSGLPPKAMEYEDGVEFAEGLAKYTEYRLLESLEGRTPRPEMWWVQGFHGYDDLSSRRSQIVDEMLRHMRGEVLVNNDQYGTAPLRMRLYYSGMAIAVVLDRLSTNWKERILQPKVFLTDLVKEVVDATAEDLHKALEETPGGADLEELFAAKRRLAEEGRARIDAMLAKIEKGVGTGIIVDYGPLEKPSVAMAFSPFGITVVDENRTIYTQVPIQARFADGSEVVQTQPMPLLHDKKGRLIRFRLPGELSPGDVARAAGIDISTAREIRELKLALPGVTVNSANAIIRLEGKDLRIVLNPPHRNPILDEKQNSLDFSNLNCQGSTFLSPGRCSGQFVDAADSSRYIARK